MKKLLSWYVNLDQDWKGFIMYAVVWLAIVIAIVSLSSCDMFWSNEIPDEFVEHVELFKLEGNRLSIMNKGEVYNSTYCPPCKFQNNYGEYLNELFK